MYTWHIINCSANQLHPMIKRYKSWISFENRKWQHKQTACWSTGNFELLVVTKTRRDPIGVSSYASLYEVIVNETVCAVKEMHFMVVYAEDSKWKSIFLTECENRCKILHPNIAQFLGKSTSYLGKKAKLLWLVMEFMHISLTGLIEAYQKEDIPLHFNFPSSWTCVRVYTSSTAKTSSTGICTPVTVSSL